MARLRHGRVVIAKRTGRVGDERLKLIAEILDAGLGRRERAARPQPGVQTVEQAAEAVLVLADGAGDVDLAIGPDRVRLGRLAGQERDVGELARGGLGIADARAQRVLRLSSRRSIAPRSASARPRSRPAVTRSTIWKALSRPSASRSSRTLPTGRPRSSAARSRRRRTSSTPSRETCASSSTACARAPIRRSRRRRAWPRHSSNTTPRSRWRRAAIATRSTDSPVTPRP